LPDQSVEEVVSAWFEGEQTMYDAVHDAPEIAWLAILRILQQDLTDEQRSILAAGPLETLVGMHGSQFIERIELEAKQNPRFNRLLGGVWKNQSSAEIWERIKKARLEEW
jgi:hypothetical protein